MAETERLRVFFDADVLIAGSLSATGASHVLLHLAELGVIEGVTSPQALREAEENLRRKLPIALPAFRVIRSSSLGREVDPAPSHLRAAEGRAHPDDVPILAAALTADCDYLVTHNTRHYRTAGMACRATAPGPLVARIRRLLAKMGDWDA